MTIQSASEDGLKKVGELRLGAIVLAAGGGRRFGGGKLTAPWRGGVLLDGALAAVFAAPVCEVVVTVGADAGVAAAVQAFAKAYGPSPRLVLAEVDGWADGLAASLKAGMAALGEGLDAVFVFLGDMPAIPPGLPQRLAATLVASLGDGATAAAPEHEGKLGHPVLFGAPLFPSLATLSGDRGARALLEAQGGRLARVRVEAPGVLFDVDTGADLEQA